MRNGELLQEGRVTFTRAVGVACALLGLSACTATASPPSGRVQQADLSDASAPAASGEYGVFTSVASVPSPGARAQTGLVYDTARGVSILYGGNSLTGPLGDTWEYDGAWKSLCDSCAGAPGARGGAGMAFAAGRGVAVVFGGYRSPGALCETWEWNGATASWRLASDPACTDTDGPSARRLSHAMADLGNDVVMFGGTVQTGSAFTRSNALFRWDGTTWNALCDADCQSQSGGLPVPRSSTALVHVQQGAQDVLFLFGGSSDAGPLNDSWQFDLATSRWSELCTTAVCRASAPSARSKHGAAFDPVRGRVVVHGGCSDQSCAAPLHDVHEYDPSSDVWRTAPPSFAPAYPDAKSDFGMAFDAKRGRIVEFGGFAMAEYLDRTVEYYTRGGTCSSDAGCDTGSCVKNAAGDATGVCAETCTGAADAGRASGCSGGFRCNEPCGAPCQTCAAVPGVCTAITSGPDDESGDAPGGHCSGANTCVAGGSGNAGKCLLVAGQGCGDGSECASGNCSRYGSHVCADAACGDKPCRPASSAGTCTTFGAGHFVPECAGKACGDDGDCLAACSSDDDCDPDYYCDSDTTHDCKRGKRYGGACKSSQECGKGTCVDGVCCDQPCGDSCQSCGKDGHCAPLASGSDPLPGHTACVGAKTGVCGGYCDGVATACVYPDGVPCGAGACVESDWRTSSQCDHGACVAGDAPVSCGAYSCSSAKCNTGCSSNAECRRGAVCDQSSGKGICNDQGTTCSSDGAAVKTASGTIVSCDGYLCSAGACAFRPCSTAADCAPGYVCTGDNRCAEQGIGGPSDASTPPASHDGGRPAHSSDGSMPSRDAGTTAPGPAAAASSCAVAAAGQRDGRSLSLLVAALALALGRRSRRPAPARSSRSVR